MKKLTLIGATILSSLIGNAQFVLENTYSGNNLNENMNFGSVKLSDTLTKYYLVDRINSQLKLYHLDHSIFKTIAIPTQPEPNQYNVIYISQTLFDNDSKIEYMIDYWEFQNESVQIYNEDGTQLFFEDSSKAASLNDNVYNSIINTENGTKMTIHLNNGSVKVYSLPGNYAGKTELVGKTGQLNISFPYPNPSNSYTRIDYQLPEGTMEGEIILYDIQGKEIKRYKIDRTFNHLRISTADLPSGTYYYNLQTLQGISEGKKMVKIK